MKKNPLGMDIKIKNKYNPSILFPISRKILREKNKININFTGFDIWNCYEFSYLNKNGKPENKIIRIIYPYSSENIVESKSLKLYLFSFTMTKFKNEEEVIKIIRMDLMRILKTDSIEISVLNYDNKIKYFIIPKDKLLDNINIKINTYLLNPSLLKTIKQNKSAVERYSNLLKTNCPVTNQPDWATLYIKYISDKKIGDSSLLKYIISFRNHAEYHESCCEKIFSDIYNILNPEILIVKCFYTRRGGIEINPCRFYGTKPDENNNFHFWRQ